MEKTEYDLQAEAFLEKTNTTFEVKFFKYDFYFQDDKEQRNIYKITLKRGSQKYTFKFGQSINATAMGEEPSAYDVLCCLQKNEVGTFADFCGDFGYDDDSIKAKKTYKAVCKEWENVKRLYTNEEINLLQEIQ